MTIPNLGPFFAGGTYALVDATGSITVSAQQLDLSGSVSLIGGFLGQGSASVDLNWTTGVYMVSGNFSMYDGIFNFGGSLTITNAGDITLEAMASIDVPPQIPFIGGDSLGSINFFLQYDAGQNLSNDFAAAWTSFSILSWSFTIGFEINFDGNISILNGSDVAALTAGNQTTASSPYVYQDTFSVPQASGTAVPIGAQISVSGTSLQEYPQDSYAGQTASSYLESTSVGGEYIGAYTLGQSDIILDSLNFTVDVQPTSGSSPVDIGSFYFTPQDQFVFVPIGTPSLVPVSATLYPDGVLVVEWLGSGTPYAQTTISGGFNTPEAWFELEQQTSSGLTPLQQYFIDPVSNASESAAQSAVQANLVNTNNGVLGEAGGGESGSPQTWYNLVAGEAVPQTVSFSLYTYPGGTLIGNGYFDSSGNLHFTPSPNEPASMVPIGGTLTTAPNSAEGLIKLSWAGTPPATSMNVTYSSVDNRVIDFNTSQDPSSSGSYVIELVDEGPDPLSSVPAFSTSILYQAPSVSFQSDSVALSSSGALQGTLLASAFTPNATSQSDSGATVSLYYNTTDSTTGGTLIGNYYYGSFTPEGSGGRSYQFSWAGFANLAAGSYYVYAVINDGVDASESSSVAGPLTETSPNPTLSGGTPVASGMSYLDLSPSGSSQEEGVFSGASALDITTNFSYPVTVTLSTGGAGLLELSNGDSASQLTLNYPSAAAAVAGLNGLEFVSGSSFTRAATLTFSVSTSVDGTTYHASDSIELLTPNTPLDVTQAVDTTIPSNPGEFNLTITVENPGGPDAQNGTVVALSDDLSEGLTVVSSTPSQGTYDSAIGLWSIGSLPTTDDNTATLSLLLQEAPSDQGAELTSSAQASSALFNYPASNAMRVVSIERPNPITITVSNLNDSGTGSLRAALQGAENGDTIDFASGLAGTILLTSGELLINQSVTIIGPTTSTGAPGHRDQRWSVQPRFRHRGRHRGRQRHARKPGDRERPGQQQQPERCQRRGRPAHQ